MIRGNLISNTRRYGIWTPIWNTIRGRLLGVLHDIRYDSGKVAPYFMLILDTSNVVGIVLFDYWII